VPLACSTIVDARVPQVRDFTDIAMAARRVAFDGDTLVAALRATFRRGGTPLPELEIVALSDRFVQDANAQANWKAIATRNRPRDFESLAQVVSELRRFLLPPLQHARAGEPFGRNWSPGGPWK
jgi:Nucleotidyl transferase AbiEii toxin, Type IV TA system